MSEFGHHAKRGPGFCIDAWGSGPFEIEVDGKRWRFEDSDRFGPVPLKKNGDPASWLWGQRSPFWNAHRQWVKQGRRLADDGVTCVWSRGNPTLVRWRGPRKYDYEIVQEGDSLDDFEIID